MQPPAGSTRMTRRQALRLVGIAGAAVAVGACAVAPSAPSAPAAVSTPQPGASTASGVATVSSSSQAAQEQPKTGGTLRWGLLGEPVTLDGHNYGGTPHVFNVFDRLIVLDEQLNWVPRLAESWDINKDYTQFKINLRKGVQWHSGREFTSDDVVWNFNRVRDPAVGGGIFASYVKLIQSVEAVDKNSVVITAQQPYPHISHLLYTMNMLDPDTMQQPNGVSKPVGTGPFKFMEYAQGDHMTLAKNANYWRTGLPYVDTLQIPIYKDPQSMVTALEAGSLDAANNVTLQDATRLQKDDKYQVIPNQNSGASYGFICNCTVEPTSNKLFRQALQWAVDRQRIVDTVLLKFGAPNNLPWYPTTPAYDAAKDKTYTFDLDKAGSLVQQAGMSNAKLEFALGTVSPEVALMAQILQADLAKIGVTLALHQMDPPALAQYQYGLKYQGISVTPAGTYLFGQVHPGVQSASPYWGTPPNWTGFNDPRFIAVTNAMATAVEPDKAKQAYAAWNDYMLDQSPVVSIATYLPRIAAATRAHGIYWDMAYIPELVEAWLG
jgi:peptide/nickel transport system substrate-binding protein